MDKHLKPNGFTLSELMIVVAIVGILASMAYPSYTAYIQRGRRADAEGILVQDAQFMERYYTEQQPQTYAFAGTTSLPITTVPPSTSGTASYYTIAPPVVSAAGNTFTITATPVNSQASDSCGALSIDQTGNKLPPTSGCWH